MILRIATILTYMLSMVISHAQQTYIKSFKVTSDNKFEFSSEMLLLDEVIYLGVHTGCDGSPCLLISAIGYDGNWQWNREFLGSDSGNIEFISRRKDTLIVSGHGVWDNEHKQLNLYYLDVYTGDSIFHSSYDLDTLIGGPGIANNGNLIYNDQMLIYGEFRNKSDVNNGLIQWAELDGTPIRTTTYNIEGNKTINALQDLQEDGYGNLVFITVLWENQVQSAVIRKLDRNGQIIKDIIIPSDNNLEPRPQLCVNNQKQYVFSHSVDDIPGYIGDVQQIVCTDTLGNILWTHNYPWKIEGQQPTNLSNNYKINQITATSDGGVVVTANVRSNRAQNRFFNDAYIGKFDSNGTFEWERRINILAGQDTLYDNCALYDIKERPDGLGYIAVGSHSPSDTSETNILLISMDSNGCIEGHSCDGEFIIVSTDEVIDITDYKNEIKIYPNPTTDRFTIKTKAANRNHKVRISDMTGIIWWHGEQQEEMDFAVDRYNNGVYLVQLINERGQIVQAEKLIIAK